MTADVRLVPVDGLEARIALRALHASVVRVPFVAAGLPPDVVEPLVTLQFDAQQAEYRTRWPDSVDHLVLRDGLPVGRCWTADVTDPTGALRAVRVLDLAVAPDARRQGVASTCLQTVIGRAADAGVDCVLQVRADNVGARALYTALGFVEDTPGTERADGQDTLELVLRHERAEILRAVTAR